MLRHRVRGWLRAGHSARLGRGRRSLPLGLMGRTMVEKGGVISMGEIPLPMRALREAAARQFRQLALTACGLPPIRESAKPQRGERVA